MFIVVKSQDPAVKNFGFIAFDETGVKNIAFLPIEKYDEFAKQNSDLKSKTLGPDETKFECFIPYGQFKDEPIKFEIVGDDTKFLMLV